MRSTRVARALFVAALLLAGCGGAPATDDGSDAPDNATADELRARSEDMFKPTSAPIRVVPSTLRNLVQWELYAGTKGVTVIGRSKTRKAKAIFVQLVDSGAGGNRPVMKGSGYLVASDFRLDARDAKRELRLLAAAIRKDFAVLVAAPPPPVDVEPAPTAPEYPSTEGAGTGSVPPPNTAADSEPSLPEAAPPPTQPSATDASASPCTRSVVKTLVWGIDLLKDAVTVVADGIQCPVSKSACGSAVEAFDHGISLIERYDGATCAAR